jgi:anti-sigma factor RsiW
MSTSALYERAPSSLRTRIQVAAMPVARSSRRSTRQLAASAAGVLVLLSAFAIVGMFLPRPGASADDRLAEQVVAGHIRSLQVDHLVDVASTDRHTVKPWFRGKLDFAPDVPDLSDEGYPLTGGRLDYIAGRLVCALVYHRRLHAINVFTWPEQGAGPRAVRKRERQGFHIRTWNQAGMAYWVVSDLGEPDLDEFVRLFQDATREPNS